MATKAHHVRGRPFSFQCPHFSNVFNGDMHHFLDEGRSVAAGIINAIIDRGTSHITYLKGDNVIPFMKVLFGKINATEHIIDALMCKDLEDDDHQQRFRDRFKCHCDICLEELNISLRLHGEHLDRNHGISLFTRANL